MLVTITLPLSCRGFGGGRARTASAMPHVDLETYIDHRRLHIRHGARLAFEMSGCIRSLNITMESKLAAVRLLRAAGWRVDLFCAHSQVQYMIPNKLFCWLVAARHKSIYL